MSTTKPDITINIIPAYQKTINEAQKILFIGQKTAAGSAIAGDLVTSIGNANEQDALFGKTSMLAAMIRAAKKINNIVRYDAISLDDDGAAVAAAGTVVFTGIATAAGSITVYVGSLKNHIYNIAVADTETATVIGDALVAAITADTSSSVIAVNVAGTVTLTAVNEGIPGNSIGIKVEGSAAGITLSTTAMTGGATNPSLTNLFDPVQNIRYQTVVWPNSYTLADVISFLDGRFNVDNKILDGQAMYSETDTFSNLDTKITALNSKSLVFFPNKIVNDALYRGSAIFELDYVRASEFAALNALRLTDGAEISRYVISTFGARDSFGGAALASLPFFNTPFFNLPLIPVGKEFSDTEITSLDTAGGSLMLNNLTNTQLITNSVLTTYKTDPAGNPDISYKFLNYVETITGVREYFFNNLKSQYSQSRLTEGDVVGGRSMANPAIIKAFIIGLYDDLAGVNYVLVQDGETAHNYFIRNLSVTVDLEIGKATVNMMVPIVTQLREITIDMQMSFSTNT